MMPLEIDNEDDLLRHYERFFAISRNAAECALCHDVIESTHGHDFVRCKCGEIFVDGGKRYLRAGAGDFSNFKSLSKYRPLTLEEMEAQIRRFQDSTYEWDVENLQKALEFRKLYYGI